MQELLWQSALPRGAILRIAGLISRSFQNKIVMDIIGRHKIAMFHQEEDVEFKMDLTLHGCLPGKV
jgi:hypothetical protein